MTDLPSTTASLSVEAETKKREAAMAAKKAESEILAKFAGYDHQMLEDGDLLSFQCLKKFRMNLFFRRGTAAEGIEDVRGGR